MSEIQNQPSEPPAGLPPDQSLLPPAGAESPGAAVPPWAPPPPVANSVWHQVAAAVVIAAVIAAAAGAGIGWSLARNINARNGVAQNNTQPLTEQPGQPAQPAQPGSPIQPAPTTGGGLNAGAIAAKVDPAIVDITSNLTGGTAEGTGMVITSGGQVLTNNHVVQGATFITAQVAGTGRKYTATVVGTDPTDDVALLQLQGASNLRTVTAGDPSKVAAGDPILAIGNALGRGGTPAVAAGNVVAVGQTITATDDTGANAETLTNLIQVDANVLPGDSGGPLVDASGKVIGMDTAASSSGRGFRFRGTSAQGFAIPIDAAMSIVQQLRNGGGAPMTTAQTSLLGVEVSDASSQGTTGALVVGIAPGTPAESAGLAPGDVIVTFGGRSITSTSTLTTAVKATKPGDRVQVAWLDQNGQQHSATVQLAAQSAPAA